MRWRAWYTDDREYEGKGVDAFKALPEIGVLVIVEYRDTGRRVLAGGDWYYWQDGQIDYVSSGDWGTWKDRPSVSCLDCVKQGVGVSNDEFEAVYQRAWRSS